MSYQLVLQFRSSAFVDVDALLALEDSLIEQISSSADVDGHDYGSGEANIFVLTSDPIDTFGAVKPVLDRAGLLTSVTVAYRPINEDRYTVLWPAHSEKLFQVA